MNNQTSIHERYLRDSLPIRMGGLAANLARIKSFSNHSGHSEAVKKLVEESKYFIEWTAADAGLPLRDELIELQKLLAGWQYNWDEIWVDPASRGSVSEQAGNWSDKILKRSGLLG